MEEIKPPKAAKPARDRNVAEELFKAWTTAYRPGDMEKMAKELGYSYPVIRTALKFGFVTMAELPGAITKFFTERLRKEQEDAGNLSALAEQAKNNPINKRKKRKVVNEQ